MDTTGMGETIEARMKILLGTKVSSERRSHAALLLLDISERAKSGDTTLADEAKQAARSILAG